jgi:hypothetical protein
MPVFVRTTIRCFCAHLITSRRELGTLFEIRISVTRLVCTIGALLHIHKIAFKGQRRIKSERCRNILTDSVRVRIERLNRSAGRSV